MQPSSDFYYIYQFLIDSNNTTPIDYHINQFFFLRNEKIYNRSEICVCASRSNLACACALGACRSCEEWHRRQSYNRRRQPQRLCCYCCWRCLEDACNVRDCSFSHSPISVPCCRTASAP